jgi:cytosine/adenosine deaminase-related metal-dependent hydrolase
VADAIDALDAVVGPLGRVGVSPHAPYTVGPALWAAMRAHPGLEGRPWATHLAESDDEARVIATGEGPLGEMFAAAGLDPGRWDGPEDAGPVARVAGAGVVAPGLVAAHCVRLGPGDPGTLARAGVAVAHCPRSNEHLRCGRAPLADLWAAGVAVGLGTDSPASGGDYDLRAEVRACRETHRGFLELDDEASLRLITIDGARALGLHEQVGSLEPGKRADLVSLRPAGPHADPLAAALRAGTSVRCVVVEGETLLRDGVVTRLDAAAIRTRSAEARGRLC